MATSASPSSGNSERADVDLSIRNAISQYELIDSLAVYHATPGAKAFFLSPEIVKEIHRRGQFYLREDAGQYRTCRVSVGNHSPPDPEDVPALVDDMCKYINAHLNDETALQIAAFTLWRLNWIHPFTEGNGATARGLCYLLLNVGLGMVLPGYQTIPELLRNDRPAYYDALADADRRYIATGEPDVSQLVGMIDRLLIVQLESSFRPEGTSDSLADLVSRRILRLSGSAQEKLYGCPKPLWRTWVIGDYTILQVGSSEDISIAEYRHGRFGDPFPSLLARAGERAQTTVEAKDSPPIFRRLSFRSEDGPAFGFARNASAAIQQPEISSETTADALGWSLVGTLYVARRGFEVSPENLAETLEPLIVRHASDPA